VLRVRYNKSDGEIISVVKLPKIQSSWEGTEVLTIDDDDAEKLPEHQIRKRFKVVKGKLEKKRKEDKGGG
jgi:hypothetical protein